MKHRHIALLALLLSTAIFGACYPDCNEHRMKGVLCYDDIDSVPVANTRLAFIMSSTHDTLARTITDENGQWEFAFKAEKILGYHQVKLSFDPIVFSLYHADTFVYRNVWNLYPDTVFLQHRLVQ